MTVYFFFESGDCVSADEHLVEQDTLGNETIFRWPGHAVILSNVAKMEGNVDEILPDGRGI